uniref:Uncharacterized protein n=1 Tax=Arundo donax TaxID=35708 RepID=A0A0A8Y5F1_ARUDO
MKKFYRMPRSSILNIFPAYCNQPLLFTKSCVHMERLMTTMMKTLSSTIGNTQYGLMGSSNYRFMWRQK